jgi:hypothetical protein
MLYDGHPEIEQGAITCRVAPSFLRFGSFEIHAARGDVDTLKKLTRFTLESFYPAFVDGETLDVVGFFAEVCRAHRGDGRRVDACRLRARRDEHRQHLDPRADHRLRAVRFPRAVRPRLDAQHHRRPGPPLPLRQPAHHHPVEPPPARPRPRAPRGRRRPAGAHPRGLRRRPQRRPARDDARQARPPRRPRPRRGTTRPSWTGLPPPSDAPRPT